MKLNEFINYIKESDFSDNTKSTYITGIKTFADIFSDTDLVSCLVFKSLLIEKGYSPSTINLRIRSLNLYNKWDGHPEIHIFFVKVSRQNFLDNIISEEDYKMFLDKLYQDDVNKDWYFLFKFLGLTGARISELLKLKPEHIKNGFMDVCGKGDKFRRLYIPKDLVEESKVWLENKKEGKNIWNWQNGSINKKFQRLGKKYGIDTRVSMP